MTDSFADRLGSIALVPQPIFDSRALQEMNDGIARASRAKVKRETTIADAAALAMRSASHSVDAIVERIAGYEVLLTADEEVALFVIGGPAGSSFFPTGIEAIDPDKIVFSGVDEGDRPFVVIQHISQLNVAMRAAKVARDEQPRRIGFHHPLGED